MRIPSGVRDKSIFFIGRKGSDSSIRQTGMAGKFSVYHGRDNVTPAADPSPSITEVDATNAPGVYRYVVATDVSLPAGEYSEEKFFHITTTDTALSTDSILPVTRTIELYNDRMNTATGQGATIIATQATHTNQLSTATTGINDAQNKAATATAGINALETSVAALETSVTFATGSIDQLLLDVADVDAGVSTATDALSALSTGGGHTADLVETVDTVVDGLRVSMDYATDTLSYLSTGGGPFPGGGSAPTATEVANAVLSQTSADHTADGTFGGDVLGSLQSATDQISQLAVDLGAIETSITYATKGIDQANIGIATATDVLSALATGGGASAISVPDILTTQMTESYAADGTAPTLAQALFLIQQELGDFAISGTTLTVRQLDGSTTAATFTLDDASAPTSKTRSG